MNFRTLLSFTLTLALCTPIIYPALEAHRAGAATDDDTVLVTLNVDEGIVISSPADAPMSQNLGVTAHEATATVVWNVATNAAGGYIIAVRATSTPAMQSSTDVVADYTPATPATPETWSVAPGDAEFGFSAFGTHVSTGTWGTDTDCVGGTAHTPSAGLNYRDLDTTDITIGSSGATTTPSGVDTTVCFAVEQNGTYIPSGAYTATIIATATTQ